VTFVENIFSDSIDGLTSLLRRKSELVDVLLLHMLKLPATSWYLKEHSQEKVFENIPLNHRSGLN
jgi:hypothetical protein